MLTLSEVYEREQREMTERQTSAWLECAIIETRDTCPRFALRDAKLLVKALERRYTRLEEDNERKA